METQALINYQRVEQAIGYIRSHFRNQPNLEEIAANIHVSPYHFQRIFTDWAGVSPKTFLQFLTLEHAKSLLTHESSTLFNASFAAGLSGPGRLHDLFIKVEGMTPAQYRTGGEGLDISYDYATSPFGPLLVASTVQGICYLAFADDKTRAMEELKKLFPRARLHARVDQIQLDALAIFNRDWNQLPQIKLHLRASPFQLRVWQALLSIPLGGLSSYAKMASRLGNPRASRAVGSAVADNPVAFLIPCHRVIQSGGQFGQYHWGPNRKAAIIGWESAQLLRTGQPV